MPEVRTIYTDVEELQQQVAALQTAMSAAQSDIAALENDTADSGWINLTLETGWSMNDYASEVPQYRKIGKVVFLRGLVNATAAANRIIATLPTGYRPAAGWYNRFNCVLNQNEYANVQININGEIVDYTKTVGTTSRSFLCLNGISFLAA